MWNRRLRSSVITIRVAMKTRAIGFLAHITHRQPQMPLFRLSHPVWLD